MPEQEEATAEAFLTNITNQTAVWPHQRVRLSQRPARLAYKAARRAEMEKKKKQR